MNEKIVFTGRTKMKGQILYCLVRKSG